MKETIRHSRTIEIRLREVWEGRSNNTYEDGRGDPGPRKIHQDPFG